MKGYVYIGADGLKIADAPMERATRFIRIKEGAGIVVREVYTRPNPDSEWVLVSGGTYLKEDPKPYPYFGEGFEG